MSSPRACALLAVARFTLGYQSRLAVRDATGASGRQSTGLYQDEPGPDARGQSSHRSIDGDAEVVAGDRALYVIVVDHVEPKTPD